MISFTSDMHLGHKRIQEFQPNRRQGTVEDHDNWVIDNINTHCGPDDLLIALGDNALGDKYRWPGLFARIVPTIEFMIGNHDPQFPANKPKYIEKYSHLYDGYQVIGLEDQMFIREYEIRMSHFPYDGDHFDGDRFEEYRPVDDGLPLLHGHTHSSEVISRSKKGSLQIHVGIDAWGRPVSQDEILELIEENL